MKFKEIIAALRCCVVINTMAQFHDAVAYRRE